MGKNFKKRQPVREKVREKALDRGSVLESLGGKKQLIEEMVSIFLAGCGLFFLFSLISYKGLNGEGLPNTHGLTGVAGGYLSFAMFQLMGYASYAVPLICGAFALLLFFQKKHLLGPLRVSFSFLTVIITCACLHVFFLKDAFLGGHIAGGALGQWIGDRLLPVFARAGTLLILGTAIIILLILVSGMSTRKILLLLWAVVKSTFALMVSGVKKLIPLIRPSRHDDETEKLKDDENEIETEEDAVIAGDIDNKDMEKVVVSPDVLNQKQKKRLARKKNLSAGKPTGFKLPPYDLLKEPQKSEKHLSGDHMKSIDRKLVDTLASYGIKGEVAAIHPGPVITTYEFRPEKGTKICSITSREDDIAMSLEAHKVRIVAPIPGKNAVGFEIPNPNRTTVYLGDIIQDPGFDRTRKKIPLSLGRDIIGRPFIGDLDKMPHLLIAGTTGSGKSVSINAMLMSLLYSFTPDEMHLILIDPKHVELQSYDGIPHLLLPVVTDPKKAALALKWAVDEMERRYQLFAVNGSKDIRSYNRKQSEGGGKVKEETSPPPSGGGDTAQFDNEDTPASACPEKDDTTAPLQPAGPLPYIVIVIDELADLMMAAVRDVEWAITRLAQKARAAGIHLIVATQRPSVNVVTGLIKANFPCRIAFRVAAKVDSRVMLDTNGAETLLGDGDMLIIPPGSSDLIRIQGAFISEEEIRNVSGFLKEQRTPTYKEEILSGHLEEEELLMDGDDSDEYYQSAINLVLSERKASVSYLQRRFSIGYNRAARIMEKMEREGVVGPSVPGKPYREVLLQSPAM